MGEEVVIYYFNNRVTEGDWIDTIAPNLSIFHPGITWNSGKEISMYYRLLGRYGGSSIVIKKRGGSFKCFITSGPNYPGDNHIPPTPRIDGTILLTPHFDINLDTDSYFNQIKESIDEFEWAREALRNTPLIPSPDYHRMTVWVFTQDTHDPESKLNTIFDSLKIYGFDLTNYDRKRHINSVLENLQFGANKPYIRTNSLGTVHVYDKITSGSSEDVFKNVVAPNGFDAGWIDVHYIQ